MVFKLLFTGYLLRLPPGKILCKIRVHRIYKRKVTLADAGTGHWGA